MAEDPVARLMAGLAERQIAYLRFELPDMHGISRSKTVPIDKVEGYARQGLNFYGGVLGLDTSSNVVAGSRPPRRGQLRRPGAHPRSGHAADDPLGPGAPAA